MLKRASSFPVTVGTLILLLLLGGVARGATVAELRERLLAPTTPASQRAIIISGLMAKAAEGEDVLREVLAGGNEDLVQATVRCVLIHVHDRLIRDVLPHAGKRDLEECRSLGLIRALAARARKTGSGDAGQALLAIEMAGGRDAVEALMDLWEARVAGARAALRRALPRDFPSAEQARAWWAGRSGKSYATILLELAVELARPSVAAESVRDRLAKLRQAHIELAREGLADARPTHVARHYLASDLVEIRRMGAEFLKAQEGLSAEDLGLVSAALLRSLQRPDEEENTLVALLLAARTHVEGLKALEPEGRACDIVLGLQDVTVRAVRLQWIDLLGEIGDGRASLDLEALYESADSEVKARVIGALLRIGNGVARWARGALDLQLALGAELDADVTGKLVNLLGKRGGSADVLILARVLNEVKSPDPEAGWAEKIRWFAAEALGTAGVARGSPEAIRALIVVGLRDPSSGVRLKAAAALSGAKGSDEARAGLEGLLREDDKDAVRHQAGISILALLEADAGPRLAAHVGEDEVLLGLLDDAVKKALAAEKLPVLSETVAILLAVDPVRTAAICAKIGEASWPVGDGAELARVQLVHAEASSLGGDPKKALEILDGIAEDGRVPAADLCAVRALALRGLGRAADAVRTVDEFLAANTPSPEAEVRLAIERLRALIAVPRLDEARAAHGALAGRADLSAADRKALAELAKTIEAARSGTGASVETHVNAWLAGTGDGDALAQMRELGARAYPTLLALLNGLTNTETPELGAFLAKLRTLTDRDFGYEKAATPAARAAARARWVVLLGG